MPPREIYDPKKPELEYYNDPNREKNFKPRKRIYTIFSTKRFMFGYAIFLTVAVLSIYTFQNGGIGNVMILSRFFGDGLKVQTTVVSQNSEQKYVFVLIKNMRYKSSTISSLRSQVTFYNKDEVLISKEAQYNDVVFDDEQQIKFALEFDTQSIANADRYIVQTQIDDKTIINKKQL